MKARDYNMQWFVLSVCGLLSGAVSSTVFVVMGYKAIPLTFSWVCSFSIEKKNQYVEVTFALKLYRTNKKENSFVLLQNSEELVGQAKIIDTCSRKPAGSASTGSTAL